MLAKTLISVNKVVRPTTHINTTVREYRQCLRYVKIPEVSRSPHFFVINKECPAVDCKQKRCTKIDCADEKMIKNSTNANLTHSDVIFVNETTVTEKIADRDFRGNSVAQYIALLHKNIALDLNQQYDLAMPVLPKSTDTTIHESFNK